MRKTMGSWTGSLLLALALLLLALPAAAQRYQSVEPDQAQLLQEEPGALYCPNCGMNLVMFYRTSHAARLPDGTMHQYCSLHCLAQAHPRPLQDVQVVDAATLDWIPAAGARYVVGSGKPGTMSPTSKYAFATEDAALEFQTLHGGEVTDFAGALAVADKALEAEIRMVAQKQAKAAEKGRKIMQTLCEGELPRFETVFAAKTWLAENRPCGELREDQMQALALALALAPESVAAAAAAPIDVPERAKCPVCAMFVAKYPGWAAEVVAPGPRTWYFDGVKDLMKFLFDAAAYGVDDLPEATTLEIRVTDYYSQTGVDARAAHYVVGSNVYGPMGNELIPFASADEAEAFRADHAGDRVVTWDGITPAIVAGLDR